MYWMDMHEDMLHLKAAYDDWEEVNPDTGVVI
jgi:hypothetical protein